MNRSALAVGGYGGALKDVPAAELAAIVVKELVRRSGVKSQEIDDVIFGQVYPNSEAPAIGRIAALDAGLDFRAGHAARPSLRVEPAGGDQRLDVRADGRPRTLIIAGGAESMSQAEYYAMGVRWGLRGEKRT